MTTVVLTTKNFDTSTLPRPRKNGIVNSLLAVIESLQPGENKGIKAKDEAQAIQWRAIAGAAARRYLPFKVSLRIIEDSEGIWVVAFRKAGKQKTA